MSKPELTKNHIAETLKALAAERKLDKISIGDIAAAAGLNRQTFYYHFRDKQDLICWIFDRDVSRLEDRNRNKSNLDEIVEYIYSEKAFYSDALTSMVQNNLREHIYRLFDGYFTESITGTPGANAMDAGDTERLARFFTHGLAGSLVQWAQEGMKTDYMAFLGVYAPFIGELLRFAVNGFGSERRTL